MKYEEIRLELESLENEIHKLIKVSLNSLSKIDDEISYDLSYTPIFLNNSIDYELLKNLHFRASLLYTHSVILIDSDSKKIKELVYKVSEAKLLYDSLIKTHKDYSKKKYRKQFEKLLKVYSGEKIIKLNKNIKNNRLHFITVLLKVLDESEAPIIENNPNNRITMASLFIPIKGSEKIQWKRTLYELKLFFDFLEKANLITKPIYFNHFISSKFKVLDKSNDYIDFKESSFKTAKSNIGYDKEYENWREIIKTLVGKLELPISLDFE